MVIILIVFHIDVNSAFLSWSAVYKLKNGYRVDLRNIPSAVCGDPKKRKGIILAKSNLAKKMGVHTGQTLNCALECCPNLTLVQPEFEIYKKYSQSFVNLLKKYFDQVEQASIDECFINYTDCQKLYKDPIKFAYKLKDEIKDSLGFTVNIGISENKLLAKMASDFEKPDKVHTLFKNEIPSKMWPLDISNLLMLGKKTQIKLKDRGFKTIGDIANSKIAILEHMLGKHGKILWEYANGIDNSTFCEKRNIKSIRSSETLPFDILTRDDAYKQILRLSEDLSKRLRDLNLSTTLITIELKDTNFEKCSHQQQLPLNIVSSTNIYNYSKAIFNNFWKGYAIRSIAITLGGFYNSNFEQLSLFETTQDNEKYKKLDKAVDNIRKKYSHTIIERASLL